MIGVFCKPLVHKHRDRALADKFALHVGRGRAEQFHDQEPARLFFQNGFRHLTKPDRCIIGKRRRSEDRNIIFLGSKQYRRGRIVCLQELAIHLRQVI